MGRNLSKTERINQFGSSFADAVCSENYSNVFAMRAYLDESGVACIDELHPCPLTEYRELPEGEWWVPAVFNGRNFSPRMVAPDWMAQKQQDCLLNDWENVDPFESYNRRYGVSGRAYFEQCLREVDEILSDAPSHGDLASDIGAREILDCPSNSEREKLVEQESTMHGAAGGVLDYSEVALLEHYRGRLEKILALPKDDDDVWEALRDAYFAGEFRSLLSRADSLAEALRACRPFRVQQDKSYGGDPLSEWQEFALALLEKNPKIKNKEVLDALERAGKARFVKAADGYQKDGYLMAGGTRVPLQVDGSFKRAMTRMRDIEKRGTSP